jgi:hypothetical protein
VRVQKRLKAGCCMPGKRHQRQKTQRKRPKTRLKTSMELQPILCCSFVLLQLHTLVLFSCCLQRTARLEAKLCIALASSRPCFLHTTLSCWKPSTPPSPSLHTHPLLVSLRSLHTILSLFCKPYTPPSTPPAPCPLHTILSMFLFVAGKVRKLVRGGEGGKEVEVVKAWEETEREGGGSSKGPRETRMP